MDFDEAAALHRYCASVEGGVVVELGRYRGGSTILISSALKGGTHLVSVDKHPQDDDALLLLLQGLGTSGNVELVRGDSSSVRIDGTIKLVYIDADHAYAGVAADCARWGLLLEPGGCLLLHDAALARWNATSLRGPRRLMSELRDDGRYAMEETIGSLACFRKR